MIWSKENLKNLSEAELCQRVLVPLFVAMGYRDVRYYHGGVLEQGKDIVMWKEDELKGRVNYGVVVKAEKITGSASIIGVIAVQAQQALGSTFVDEVTQEAHTVHEVILVTSREISKEGHEALLNSSRGAQVHRDISKIDGDRLWSLVEKYLPHEAVFSSLTEASKALNELDPDFGYVVELAPGTVHMIAFPKGGSSPPPISFAPQFPDTPEGREQGLAFQRFRAAGQPAEVKAEYIAIKGLPSAIQRVLNNDPGGTLSFGPRKSLHTRAVVLLFKAVEEDEEKILFPLIEFGSNVGGDEELTLSNDQQPIPFKFHLTLRWSEIRTNFRFNFEEAEKTAFSLLRANEFQAALARGGTLVVQDFVTGHRLAGFDVQPSSFPPPGEKFMELLRKLVWIQQQLGIEIELPERDFFEPGDEEEILSVETIVRTGRLLGRCSDANVVLKPGALREILDKHPNGVLGEMVVVQEHRERILGTEINLGPIEISTEKAYIEQEELIRLKKTTEENPSIRLVPEGGAFDVRFRNWPKQRA